MCAENEKDRVHLVGRTAEEKAVMVAPDVLATYVGVYQVTATSRSAQLAGGAATVFTVTLEDGQLLIDLRGKGKVPMIPAVADDVLAAAAGNLRVREGRQRESEPDAGPLGGGSADGGQAALKRAALTNARVGERFDQVVHERGAAGAVERRGGRTTASSSSSA